MASAIDNVATARESGETGNKLGLRPMRFPDEFPRRVLLAVAGMSPQVITETLYGLGHAPRPFYPTEVVVVTTGSGRQRILLELLGEEHGWFRRLYTEYPAMRVPRFSAKDVRVIATPSGELDDIRGEDEHALAADMIADCVREFTADDECALHVSMAGGRKTMGYFAGAALSLYGRAQDRLSHVLVSEAFESHPQFFYPAPKQRVIYHTRDQRPLDSQDARVTLADIPFVRLRQSLPGNLVEQRRPFQEAIAAARRAVEPPAMRVWTRERQICIGTEERHVPPAELAFFLWLWTRQRTRKDPIHCPSEGGDLDCAREYEAVYLELNDLSSPDSPTRKALREGMPGSYFLQKCSKWNALLMSQFGDAARPFRVEAFGNRGEKLYRIPAREEQVVVESTGKEKTE